MIKKIEKLSGFWLVIIAIVINICFFTAKGVGGYLAHNSAVKNGELVKTAFTIEDFTINSMSPLDDGSWRTTDTDPQLILEYNGKVDGISLEMTSQLYTGEILVYYTENPDQDFSLKNRLILVPDENNENIYSASIPLKYLSKIRIDPTAIGGNLLQIGDVTVNPDKTLSDYLQVTPYDILILMIYTAFTASILKFVQEIFTKKS